MAEEQQQDFKNAQADAKAAAARAKALRPWYRKKRFVIGIPIGVLVLLAAVSGGSSDGGGNVSAPATGTAASAANATTPSVGTNSGDVHVPLAVNSSGEIFPAGNENKKVRVTILQIADDFQSNNLFMQPTTGKKYWGMEVVVENIGTAEASSLAGWKLRDSTDQEYDLAFLVDGPGPALDPVYTLTPGGKKQGWVYFEIAADAQPKWIQTDPNPFLRNDLYFDAQ